MNVSLIRRFAIFFAIVAVILTTFASVNLIRFAPDKWLATKISPELTSQLSADISSGHLGTQLTWVKPELEWQGYIFSATEMTVEFNVMSVIIGKPSLKSMIVNEPFLQVPASELNIQQLRLLIGLAFQQLEVHNGYFLSGNNEVQNIELSMLKNGVFGEYAVQLSGELVGSDLSANLNYSTLVGIDGDNKLVMGKTQFDANVVFQNWAGRMSGKIKTLLLTETNNAEIKFLSWSSAWRTNAEFIPYTIDWAGGLTNAQYTDGTWTLSTVDTALAFVDNKDIAHTFALQSNNTQVTNGDLDGQLGLSLLTEFPAGSEWQSYNLVMSGSMLPGKSIFEWTDPDIRLSLYDNDTQLHNHNIKVRELTVDLANKEVNLNDGEWQMFRSDLPEGDFGFGQLSGNWPTLQFNNVPNVAAPLQSALSVIAPDVEYLDALFNYLVP